jgi:hypothetical protein
VAFPQTASASYLAFGARLGVEAPILSKVRLLGVIDVVGVVTPMTIAVKGDATSTVPGTAVTGNAMRTQSGPVEASAGIALMAPIF